MDIEKVSNLIRQKRKEKGFTQEELARHLNVTEKAISRWETGRGTPDISLLVPLAEQLDVSVSELLKGKEDIKEDNNIKEIVDYIDITKEKKNKRVIYIASFIYGILLLLYLWYLRVDYNLASTVKITYLGELVYNLFFIVSLFLTNRYIANNYYDTIEDRIRMNKISYIMTFVIYLVMLFNLTIFKRYIYGYSFNLIPFKTILYYLDQFYMKNFLINIVGNIIILMPVQYLIIKIFDIKKYKHALLIDLIMVLLIETIQLLSHTGIFDIDDIILNILGMSIMYYIVYLFKRR